MKYDYKSYTKHPDVTDDLKEAAAPLLRQIYKNHPCPMGLDGVIKLAFMMGVDLLEDIPPMPEIKFEVTKIDPPTQPRKFEFGRWAVCSKCGQNVHPDNGDHNKLVCHNKCFDASVMTLRQYTEEVLKKPFEEEKWSFEEETLDCTTLVECPHCKERKGRLIKHAKKIAICNNCKMEYPYDSN